MKRSAIWLAVMKPAVALLLLISTTLPGICATMCVARVCCSPKVSASKTQGPAVCSKCPSESVDVHVTSKAGDCCAWIAEKSEVPATSHKIFITATPAILPAPFVFPALLSFVESEPLAPANEAEPPDPLFGLHHSRAPPRS